MQLGMRTFSLTVLRASVIFIYDFVNKIETWTWTKFDKK